VFIATWREEYFITEEEEATRHKKIGTIMEEIYSEVEERMSFRKIKEKYQA
jgi:hypothetical protein